MLSEFRRPGSGSRSQLGSTDEVVQSSSARVSLPRPVQPLLIEFSKCLVRSSLPTFLKAIGQLSPLEEDFSSVKGLEAGGVRGVVGWVWISRAGCRIVGG